MLETLDLLARHCRDEVGKPFGGMQLVFCGDFFQLPPVEVGRGVCLFVMSHPVIDVLLSPGQQRCRLSFLWP